MNNIKTEIDRYQKWLNVVNLVWEKGWREVGFLKFIMLVFIWPVALGDTVGGVVKKLMEDKK